MLRILQVIIESYAYILPYPDKKWFCILTNSPKVDMTTPDNYGWRNLGSEVKGLYQTIRISWIQDPSSDFLPWRLVFLTQNQSLIL